MSIKMPTPLQILRQHLVHTVAMIRYLGFGAVKVQRTFRLGGNLASGGGETG